mmetsp:Transcript_29150/g.67751  ORF Transcript_29150/g.67751 Transcript_29150/m.67751 type:complete len:557 (-) Transcript_29150:113-1783(-)
MPRTPADATNAYTHKNASSATASAGASPSAASTKSKASVKATAAATSNKPGTKPSGSSSDAKQAPAAKGTVAADGSNGSAAPPASSGDKSSTNATATATAIATATTAVAASATTAAKLAPSGLSGGTARPGTAYGGSAKAAATSVPSTTMSSGSAAAVASTPASSSGYKERASSKDRGRPSTSASMAAAGMSGENEHGPTCNPQERDYLQKLLVSARSKERSSTDFYSFGKVIGTGSFAKVRVARHKLTGQHVAIKTYEKSKIKDPNAWRRIQQEIRLMEKLDHPLVIRIFETVESPRRIHIVMEHLSGGNLCSHVKSRRSLPEDEARNIFVQIAQSLEYMHINNIIHRDIKLENVLFDEDKNAKLIDFGFSVYCRDKRLKVFCGTPSYMAPEIVKRTEYRGKPIDVWSLGIVLYAMLCGCFPFSAKTYPDLYKKIIRGSFRFPDNFPPGAKDLLQQMLVLDPSRRATISEARNHPWCRSTVTRSLKHTKAAQYTVSSNPRDDIYREAVTRMETLGVENEALIGDLMSKKRNGLTTCYYLLAAAMNLPNGRAGHPR